MPKGEFDFYQAKEACANQGAKMYAPESKLQRLATMTWFQKCKFVCSYWSTHDLWTWQAEKRLEG